MRRLAGLGALLGAAAVAAPPPGVLVEDVEPGGAGFQAGLLPGDLLRSWSAAGAAASTPIDSPFALLQVEILRAPLGRITLRGSRGGEPLAVELPPGEWRLATRPILEGDVLTRFDEAGALLDRGESAEAAAALRRAAEAADGVTGAWLLLRAARALGEAGRWDEAGALVPEAARRAAESGDPGLAVTAWRAHGLLCESKSRFEEAERAQRAAVDRTREFAPGGLLEADALQRLGAVALKRGDLAAAEESLLAALAILQERAPGGAEEARARNALGVTYRRRGGPEDYDRAASQHARALAISREAAPGGYDNAYSLMALGNVAWMRGDLSAASAHYGEALPIFEIVAPETLAHAAVLDNLGNVQTQRGDLARAEELYRRVAAIRQRLAPDGLEVAMSWARLGSVCQERGDFEVALELHLRALAIREQLAPGSEETAASLLNLATVAIHLGDHAEAEEYYTRALRIAEARSPGNVDVASAHQRLGDLAALRGDFDAAEASLVRAEAIWREVAPGSTLLAWTLHTRGEVARERGNLEDALRHHREALDLRTARAPGSMREADSAAAVARCLRLLGRDEEALAVYRRAMTALESQQGKLGGVEAVRTEFRSDRMDIYRDAIDLLVELDRETEAFDLLERSRARGFRSLLAERDLVFSADIPEELDRRRRMTAAEYDQVRESLQRAAASGADDAAAALQDRLAALRRALEEIREEVRRASPRLAALQEPKALDLATARRSLDPGTLLLSYSVGRDRTLLFAVDASGSLSVATIPAGAAGLADRVRAFRETIAAAGRSAPGADPSPAAEALYGMLVAPVDAAVAEARRLLIVPDGTLHLLPFAALRRPARGDLPAQYLVEWRPLHLAASMTVLEELRAARTAQGPASLMLLAFGDPRYVRRGGDGVARSLPPLPASREEVQAIAALFGEEARMFLQEDATESRARAVGPGVRMIHFAAHALIDERHPLDSAIALTVPETVRYGRDNGLLQAWEILESVRIDADLVTLSGCDTALGRELAGEGIIGLTRAFQYAGARTVAASLWSVPDRSTAILMQRFYGSLKEGLPKDEALRAAQLDLIRGAAAGTPGAGGPSRGIKRLAGGEQEARSYASPFHWAAFQLHGDWR